VSQKLISTLHKCVPLFPLLASLRGFWLAPAEPSSTRASQALREPIVMRGGRAFSTNRHTPRGGAHQQPCARGAHGIIFLTTWQPSTADLFNIPSSPQQGLYWLLWRPPATSRRLLPVHRGHLISISSTMQLRPWQTTTMFQSFRLHAQAKCYLQLNIFMASIYFVSQLHMFVLLFQSLPLDMLGGLACPTRRSPDLRVQFFYLVLYSPLPRHAQGLSLANLRVARPVGSYLLLSHAINSPPRHARGLG
jgi:hypothetical protein